MSQLLIKGAHNVKKIKNAVSALQTNGSSVQVSKTGAYFVIHTDVDPELLRNNLLDFEDDVLIDAADIPKQRTHSIESVTISWLHDAGVSQDLALQLCSTLPKKWSIYTPMVLFGPGTFDSELWKQLATRIDLCKYFEALRPLFPGNITHFAVNKPIIEEDVMRRPFNLVPLYGDFGPEPTSKSYNSPTQADLDAGFWCHTIQNKIYQTWAPRYTMFSRGNIKEKKRLLQYANLENLVAVDLYAGIGYFSLSYLANGATLFCWEINRWSIEGFVRGLKQNKHKYRLVTEPETISPEDILLDIKAGVKAFVFHESNERALSRLEGLDALPISHINLGLLPSLKPSWAIAKQLIEQSTINTLVHVHENVHIQDFEKLQNEVSETFGGPAVIERVKTFAPDVWHVVVDCKSVKA